MPLLNLVSNEKKFGGQTAFRKFGIVIRRDGLNVYISGNSVFGGNWILDLLCFG